MRSQRYGFFALCAGLAALLAACADSSPTTPNMALEAVGTASVVVDCDDPEDIADRIDALETDGTINSGQATALRAKLAQAARAEAEGRPDKVAEAYERLARQVDDLADDGTLSEEQAEELIACIEDVADGPDPDLLFTTVAAGDVHACGLTAEGSAYCWGNNAFGELGIGETDGFYDHPVPVAGDLTFRSITAGGEHTCGITTDQVTYCWGYNGGGELGNNGSTNSDVPVPVATGSLTFVSISAGGGAFGEGTTCAVTGDGVGYCWGSNWFGKAGIPEATTSIREPVAVGGGLAFRSIRPGMDHTCGLTTEDQAYCWGKGMHLGTGDFSHENGYLPVAVAGGLSFQDLDAGREIACGVTSAGAAYCWGTNGFGQLGDGTLTSRAAPTLVVGGHTFESVSVSDGSFHTCALTLGGDAYCWGNNDLGQLGNGDAPNDTLVPSQVAGGLTFESVAAGVAYTCAVAEGDRAYCWGHNLQGRLGDGNAPNDSDVPVPVATP